MVINVGTCHDCNTCLMACKDEHVGNDWPGYTAPQPRHGHRWINVERRERGQYPRNDIFFRSTPCQHCENAPCVKNGNGAISRREDGIVLIDPKKAKGKKELVDLCPYGAIFYNDEEDVAQKCTMCAHLLDNKDWLPGIPRCAHSCVTGTIKAYNIEPAEMAKMVKDEGLSTLKPELGTKPHVYYKNLEKFEKNHITGAVLVDGDCFQDATVTLKTEDGAMVCTMTGPGGVATCSDPSALDQQPTNCFGDFKFDGLENGTYILDIDADGKTAQVLK